MSIESPEVLTVQQRLASSRHALMNRLQGDEQKSISDFGFNKKPGIVSDFLSRSSYGTLASNFIGRWWSRHPVNAAGQLARPFLERYARQQPVKLMAISASVGAFIILIKPWRLLSTTALLASFLKTSNVADMVTSLMKSKYDR